MLAGPDRSLCLVYAGHVSHQKPNLGVMPTAPLEDSSTTAAGFRPRLSRDGGGARSLRADRRRAGSRRRGRQALTTAPSFAGVHDRTSPRDPAAVAQRRLVAVGELLAAALGEPEVQRALDQPAALELVEHLEQRSVSAARPSGACSEARPRRCARPARSIRARTSCSSSAGIASCLVASAIAVIAAPRAGRGTGRRSAGALAPHSGQLVSCRGVWMRSWPHTTHTTSV